MYDLVFLRRAFRNTSSKSEIGRGIATKKEALADLSVEIRLGRHDFPDSRCVYSAKLLELPLRLNLWGYLIARRPAKDAQTTKTNLPARREKAAAESPTSQR